MLCKGENGEEFKAPLVSVVPKNPSGMGMVALSLNTLAQVIVTRTARNRGYDKVSISARSRVIEES